MSKWFFEPGHTEAQFRARHMMVTWVRGMFKNISGKLEFDPAEPEKMSFETEFDAASLWTGVPQRDDHLRSADFLDVANFPKISFKSKSVHQVGCNDYRVTGDLTIRGTTREVVLDVRFLGEWQTPWWEDGVNKGPKRRAGFEATTRINRYDFGVNWNDSMPGGGVVVSPWIDITIDAEAVEEN